MFAGKIKYFSAANPPQDIQPAQGSSNGYPTPRGWRGGYGGRGGRGRGRGRGGPYTPNHSNTVNGINGNGSGRGRGRGAPPPQDYPDYHPRHSRGLGASADSTPIKNTKVGPNSTLSDLLFASRPLLRPVKFVKSEQTPFLFQYDQEEILKPAIEEIGDDEQSHVPTADRVERIFHGDVRHDSSSSSSSDEEDSEDGEEIEEIDFNNLDQLLASPSTQKQKQKQAEDLDFTIYTYAGAANPPQDIQPAQGSSNGYPTPRGWRGGYGGRGGRGRGRGRGGPYTPNHSNTVNGINGNGSGRGRGRGAPPPQDYPDYHPRHSRGLGASADSTPIKNTKVGPNSTLSDLLFASRPLLRPVKFVKSEQTPFLFQYDQEEILKPAIEEIGDDEQSHVPTADRVERIFHGDVRHDTSSSSSSDEEDSEDEEEIEEIDFNNLDQLLASPSTQKQKQKQAVKKKVKVDEDVQMDVESEQDQPPQQLSHLHSYSHSDSLFFIDTSPGTLSPTLYHPQPPSPSELPPPPPLPGATADDDDDEEVIVYVAPHPRIHSRRTTTAVPSATAPAPPAEAIVVDTDAHTPDTGGAAPTTTTISIETTDNIPQPQPPPIDSPQTEPSAQPESHQPPILTISSLKFGWSSGLQQVSNALSSGRKIPSILSPRVAKKHNAWERKKAKCERQKSGKGRGRGRFAAYGAVASDRALYGGDEDVLEDEGVDKKWEQRRRGDSDLDWGTEDEEDQNLHRSQTQTHSPQPMSEKAKGKQKAHSPAPLETDNRDVEKDEHGMDVDSEMDVEAMKQFVSGLMGKNAGVFKTMDDVEVEEKIKREDENGPKSSFQARLERLRAKARSKKPQDGDAMDDSDEDEDMLEMNMAWAEQEDDYDKLVDHIQDGDAMDDSDEDEDMLEMNMAWAEEEDDYHKLIDQIQDVLDSDVDRKSRNKLFRAVQNGDFADMQPARKRKDKPKDLPPDLEARWELDRQRKAERKREREREKLSIASDPFSKKKGGKKGRKAMLKVSSLPDSQQINLSPNRIIDLTTLIQQIRRFISDLNGPHQMSLPPANKETRKNIHELAAAFNLKSASKGQGRARYTTLTKTSKTGEGRVDEFKVGKIARRAGGMESGRKGRGGVPKHREGDKVGASAPKIGEGNVGFKMLAAMGWAEGDRIGLSGGLEAPLVAIIKHSKLGLGATK
ncbi:G-patch and R3H domain-containing protein C30B4.02c [Leucoagaricus sp. SymC.cos]|nr:G-patch and R3H domain-containing protein C30B4.02c [Leucoagaricus sp. SymC.cos]